MNFTAILGSTIDENGIKRRSLLINSPKLDKALEKHLDGQQFGGDLSLTRDPQRHRHLFAMFKTTLENLSDGFSYNGSEFKFPNDSQGLEAFRYFLKVAVGFVDIITWTKDGKSINRVEPKSLDFAECSQKQFEEFFELATNFMAKLLKVEVHELLSGSLDNH